MSAALSLPVAHEASRPHRITVADYVPVRGAALR